MLFKTCKQSFEMYFPGSPNKIMGFGIAPPVPTTWDGTLIRHEDDKTITVGEFETHVTYSDGREYVYPRKPTLQQIVNSKPNGGYFQMHSDGSVEHGIGGEYYRWEEDIFTILDEHYYTLCWCRDCVSHDYSCGDYDTIGYYDSDDYYEPYLARGDAWLMS